MQMRMMRRVAWFYQDDQLLLDMHIPAHTTNAHDHQLSDQVACACCLLAQTA